MFILQSVATANHYCSFLGVPVMTSKLGNVVVVQFEDALSVTAVGHYIEMDKVLKCLDRRDKGGTDDGVGEVSNVQGF